MKTLALINNIDEAESIIKKALTFVQNDTLEVMFVHEEELFELPDLFRAKFEKDETINKEKTKKHIQEIVQKLGYDKDVATFVYISDTYSRVEATQKDINPLIVTTLNKYTQELLDSKFKIFFIKKNSQEYKNIALTVNLNDEDEQNIELAQNLFPNAKITLLYDYMHLITIDMPDIDPSFGVNYNPEIDEEIKEERKKLFEDLKQEYSLDGVFLEDFTGEDSLITYIKSNNDTDLLLSINRDKDLANSIEIDVAFL